MLSRSDLYCYQNEGVNHLNTHPRAMLFSFLGSGKMQPLSEPVLTPEGWSIMGDIKVGSMVIGSDGLPKEVTNTFFHSNKKMYKVIFNDGSYARCGGEHLWYVKTPYQKRFHLKGSVLSTEQILKEGIHNKHGQRNHSVPLVNAVKFSPKRLTIDPYLLGVILGDGCVNKKGHVTLCTDIEIIESCGLNVTRMHDSSCYTGYAFIKGIQPKIEQLNLQGKRSWEKHAPIEYMTSSVEQRLALLQGLLDTDGSPDYRGASGIEYSSTSEKLTDSVVELTQSLGGIARKSKPRITKHQGGKGIPSWRVEVKLPIQYDPFRLTRKKEVYVKPSKYQCAKYIAEIIEDGIEDAQCITINSTDSLYVTRNYILTHNTLMTLTSIVDRMNAGQITSALIIAPLRVCYAVWENEAKKWEHTKHLTFSIMHGNEKKRKKTLFSKSHIYLINYEGLNWLTDVLLKYYIGDTPMPFQMVVYDEISQLKNSQSVRMKLTSKREIKDVYGNPVIEIKKGWRNIMDRFSYTVGLTGTPASNGYIDLFGQYLVIDGGVRLGKHITHYRGSYFKQSFNGFGYDLTDLGKQAIEDNIKDITLSMNNANDYLDLPKVTIKNMFIELPPKARKIYNEIETEMFIELDNGVEVEVFNKASLTNKTLQIATGDMYTDLDGNFEHIHTAKLEALEEIMEEAAGQPVLVAYNFKVNAEKIMKKFKKYKPVNMTAEKSSNTGKIIKDWNSGKIKLLLCHPKCLGANTLVLTEFKGWVKLIDVDINDRVFDGIEFVSHQGCNYSGHKEVIDVNGIIMTPDHKLLVSNKWIKAEDIRSNKNIREKALYKYKGNDKYLIQMCEMWERKENSFAECSKTQQKEHRILYPVSSQDEIQQQNIQDLERDEREVQRSSGQKLWRKRYKSVQRVGRFFCKILLRYGVWVQREFNNRKKGCEWELRKRQLHLDNNGRSTSKQAYQQNIKIQRKECAFSRTMSYHRMYQDNITTSIEQRNDSGRSCKISIVQSLWEESKTKKYKKKDVKKEHVYDLVNCGKRSRFLIKNENQDIFISHNSAGHGIDGLQESGSIIVWMGINWNLEYYLQLNGRLDRNGQKHPVSIIRILANNTIDLAVADSIDHKFETQEGLKNSLQKYRAGFINKDLEISFL